ncbi:MAG: hypothetical protein WCK31_01170 [bacterium]
MRKDLEYLFISKVRIGVLKLFLTHQDVPYFLREVVRQIREEVNAVRRELIRLEEIGFVKAEPKGNKIYYTVNTSYTYYPELVRIIFKSFGLGAEIIRNDKNIGNIKYCFLTSSYTRGIKNSESDVDLIIVGDVDMPTLDESIKRSEKDSEKLVNYTVLKPFEFEIRKKRKDPFILQALLGSKVMLIGDEDEMIVE